MLWQLWIYFYYESGINNIKRRNIIVNGNGCQNINILMLIWADETDIEIEWKNLKNIIKSAANVSLGTIKNEIGESI
jgi:hypothetical protein